MPQFRIATTGDTRVRYLDSGGDDRGAPVVFVPGFTCVADDYTEVLPLFGRCTLVVELRGHGRSVAPHGPYDAAARAGDIGAAIDAVTDGPAHLMTFSRGTSYALTWALAHRERVRSISIGDYLPEEIFPAAWLHEFPDSPHDIFRPDRGRYPLLVRDLVDSVDSGSRVGQGR